MAVRIIESFCDAREHLSWGHHRYYTVEGIRWKMYYLNQPLTEPMDESVEKYPNYNTVTCITQKHHTTESISAYDWAAKRKLWRRCSPVLCQCHCRVPRFPCSYVEASDYKIHTTNRNSFWYAVKPYQFAYVSWMRIGELTGLCAGLF